MDSVGSGDGAPEPAATGQALGGGLLQNSESELDRASCMGSASSVISSGSAPVRSDFVAQIKLPLPIIYHTDFRGHRTRLHGTLELHQESPDRVHHIFSRLLEENARYNHVKLFMYTTEVPLATDESLLAVHDSEYVTFLQGLCTRYDAGSNSDTPSDHEVLRFSPLVVSRLFSEDEKRAYFSAGKHLSSATRFSPGSYKAALRASGAIIRAVNIVMGEEHPHRRCFCLLRPPGHHAGPRGYDPVAGGCGFCLVNNVMVGVAEAYRLQPNCRVAIVDLDVHHGNGTQAIIEKRFADAPILFCSIHLHETVPGDPDQDFFPGTGAAQNTERILNVPIEPLWKGEAGPSKQAIRTATEPGAKRKAAAGDAASASKRLLAASGVVPAPEPFPHPGDPTPEATRGRVAWRHALEYKVLPKLQGFRPDILFISAGFDGLEEDEGCLMDNVSGLDLTESDYAWATEQLVERGGASRVVSALEGGYGKWSAQMDMYDTSPLVSACLAHINALVEKTPPL